MGRWNVVKKKSFLSNILEKIPSNKLRYGIIIALAGALLLIVSNIFSTNESTDIRKDMNDAIETNGKQSSKQGVSEDTSFIEEIESNFEKDLERMLNEISGVSEVEVMINLDSTNIQVFDKNLVVGKQTTDESDTNGGTRTIEDQTEETETVLVRQGDEEVPLLVHTKKPKVRGVFIIGKGINDVEKKKWVIESVSRVLDVPTHKVSVIPK